MATTTHTLPVHPAVNEQIATGKATAKVQTKETESSAVDLYSASDGTDTEDEWFNKPESSQPKTPQSSTARDNDANDSTNDPWATSWDRQPESGPLIVPSLHVTPSPSTEALHPPEIVEDGKSRPKSAPPVTSEGLPPAYEPRPGDRPALSRTSTGGSDVSDTSLPPYETASAASSTSPKTAPGFYPTSHLQIETAGIGMIRIPVLPPRSDPVLIRAVSHDGLMGPAAYKSLQSSRTSGSCVLVNGETELPLCTTAYAPGPIRSPKLRLVKNANEAIVTPREAGKFMKIKPPHDAEIVSVSGDRANSRACSIRTSLGHFRWRYGTREEKREAKGPIMIFERIREKTLPNGKKQETRKRIGQLLRNEELRTAGSGRMAAGNGGRLMLDLNEWADRKEESRSIEVLAVSSCLVMLRKEMNQRRLRQAAVMATTAAIL
ncbi:hypothetical protein LIA77_07959 [Sarocladium implicatum]|nr:hypothetical protein LIA77_07959 [Sarocladium implicatum]